MRNSILLLLLVGFSVSGCLKIPKILEDEGPPVDVNVYQKTVIDAWGNAAPEDIQAQESVQIDKTISLVGATPKLIQQELLYILKMEDDSSKDLRHYIMPVLTRDYKDSGNYDEYSKQNDFYIDLKTGNFAAESMVTTSNFSFILLFGILNICSPQNGYKITCHNLSTWESVEKVPAGVARPACEGLPNCEMKVKNIQFDLIHTSFDEEKGSEIKEKFSYRIRISPDLPVLARIPLFCVQGLLKSNDTPFVAEVCSEVYSFSRGVATP